MGGDGGYMPKRSDLVTKAVPQTVRRFVEHRRLASGYWDCLGNAHPNMSPGRIQLKVREKRGYAYCVAAEKWIRRAMFSIPCGCVFDLEIAEFVKEHCPVCDERAGNFVEISAREV